VKLSQLDRAIRTLLSGSSTISWPLSHTQKWAVNTMKWLSRDSLFAL
jgi:hypothetical protein